MILHGMMISLTPYLCYVGDIAFFVDVESAASLVVMFPIAREVGHVESRHLHSFKFAYHLIAIARQRRESVERHHRCLAVIGEIHLLVVVSCHGHVVVFAVVF